MTEEKRLQCRRVTFWLAWVILAALIGWGAGLASAMKDYQPVETAPVGETTTETVKRPAAKPVVAVIAPAPAEEPTPQWAPEEDLAVAVEALAQTVWGEARGCSTTEQAAVVWCILNRVDDPRWPDTILEVVTQSGQFHGYNSGHPATEEHLALAWDVVERWIVEKNGDKNVGRILPAEYVFFAGDGKHNHFRTEYRGGTRWDWSLDSPYEEE